jgi:rod shape-determining protein MreD
MRWLSFVAPTASVAALSLIAALPWGLPAADRFFLPLLPVVAIYYWTLSRDAWLPEWVVFLAGLTLDILTNGPLGYWAFIYLIAHLIATLSAGVVVRGGAGRLALVGLTIVAVTVVAWAVASAYFFEPLDWVPYATGALFAGFAALIVAPFVGGSGGTAEPGQNLRLTRGS